jgi:hypothetical protein
MILVESLVQLLSEKGLLEREELFERVKMMRAKTGTNGTPKGWRNACMALVASILISHRYGGSSPAVPDDLSPQ